MRDGHLAHHRRDAGSTDRSVDIVMSCATETPTSSVAASTPRPLSARLAPETQRSGTGDFEVGGEGNRRRF